MKLRILGNSLRLRLTQSEVAVLGEIGRVEEAIRFGPNGALVYALEASDEVEVLTAWYEEGALTVLVPKDQIARWVDTNRVGLEGTQPLGGDAVLTILVEKDFKCLHGPASRQEADAFPHPEAL